MPILRNILLSTALFSASALRVAGMDNVRILQGGFDANRRATKRSGKK